MMSRWTWTVALTCVLGEYSSFLQEPVVASAIDCTSCFRPNIVFALQPTDVEFNLKPDHNFEDKINYLQRATFLYLQIQLKSHLKQRSLFSNRKPFLFLICISPEQWVRTRIFARLR